MIIPAVAPLERPFCVSIPVPVGVDCDGCGNVVALAVVVMLSDSGCAGVVIALVTPDMAVDNPIIALSCI
jgi:hypothetical protein